MKKEVFNPKITSKLFGKKISDNSYWLSDGHCAFNYDYFSMYIKTPPKLEAVIELRQDFTSQNQKTVEKDMPPPDIERVIPQGPRYILRDTKLNACDDDTKQSYRILEGYDRLVYMHERFIPLVSTLKVNILQNNDKLGLICVYSADDEIEKAMPIAVISPIRSYTVCANFRLAITSMSEAITRGRKVAA